MRKMNLEDYLRLPYKIELFRDNDTDHLGWVANVPDLPGCITQADSFEELEKMIEDAKRAWIETALERGIPIPEPRMQEEYSGKFVVRVPRSLHHKLVEAAETDGVSLNQFINVVLAESINAGPRGTNDIVTSEFAETNQWPGLSAGARQVLAANGYLDESRQADERLFSEWIADHLNQAQTALQDGEIREGQDYLENLNSYLDKFSGSSPILHVYSKTVRLLIAQLAENRTLRKGVVERYIIEQRINNIELPVKMVQKPPTSGDTLSDLFTEDFGKEDPQSKMREMFSKSRRERR